MGKKDDDDDSSTTSSSSSSSDSQSNASKTKDSRKERYAKQKAAERNLIKVVKSYRHLPTMRMSMGQRRFLFFWHLAVILVSVGMIGMGAFLNYWLDGYVQERVRTNRHFKSYIAWVKIESTIKLSSFYGSIIEEYGSALMVLGLTYLFVTFFYISFLGHRFQFTWPILVIINIVALVFELSNILVRLSPVAQLSSTQQRSLKEKIATYKIKSEDEFSLTYDFLSIWGKCCGISSMYDFQYVKIEHEESVNGETVPETYKNPAVCCKEELFKKGYDAVRKCAINQVGTYEIGCFNVFFDLFTTFNVVYVFAIGFFLMDLVVHISIYRDMVARLEPELGIDNLNRLERDRRVEWEANNKATKNEDMFLVRRMQNET